MAPAIICSLYFQLTVVDTADGEKFQSLTSQYYRRTNIVLLVCSLDDEVSFNRLTKWHQESLYYIDEQDTVYGVCGVKSDLHDHEKEVTLELMQGFARHVEFPENCVFEVSARTGSGITDMLKTVCCTAVEKMRRHSQDLHRESYPDSFILISVPCMQEFRFSQSGQYRDSLQLPINSTSYQLQLESALISTHALSICCWMNMGYCEGYR